MDETSVVRHEDNLPASRNAEEPLAILRLAVEKGIDAESLERLCALAEHREDRQAAREFADALRTFQERCPPIQKAAEGGGASRKGGGFAFKYAKLDAIDRIVRPILADLGLSYSWDAELTESGLMRTTCTLRHVNGHRETSSFVCPTSSASPGMSDQHKYGGATTFGRRVTLTAVLGLTTTEEDTGGFDPVPITQKQAADLECLVAEVGANEEKFLRWLNVEKYEDISAERFNEAIRMLRAKAAKDAQR
jgi:hypothetical protein